MPSVRKEQGPQAQPTTRTRAPAPAAHTAPSRARASRARSRLSRPPAQRLRERAQHDHVAVVDQRQRRLPRVLEVRLVDDERPRARQRRELAERAVRAAREREHRLVVADRGARELRGNPVNGIRAPRLDRDLVARPRERARAQEDQVVGADAEHDVLGIDAVVVGDRAVQLLVAAGRIVVDPRERLRDRPRPRRRQRQRRGVLVEANHLRDVDARELRGHSVASPS